MHPVLFEFQTPDFLTSFLPSTLTIYTYGALIALGAVLGAVFLAWQSKKDFAIPYHETNNLVLIVIIASIVGGKFFFYLESPGYYFGNLSNLINDPGNGFVFYGSLVFSIVGVIIYLRWKKTPILPMLDILAITSCIVHFFGRLGCFNAGCCYGHAHEGIFSVVFTNPQCMAKPLNTGLHPTQLYSAVTILVIGVSLFFLQKKKVFNGQVFLSYIMLYAIGRSIIEVFRGDLARGFIIEDTISHSQFIAFLMLLIAGFFYIHLRKKSIKNP